VSASACGVGARRICPIASSFGERDRTDGEHLSAAVALRAWHVMVRRVFRAVVCSFVYQA